MKLAACLTTFNEENCIGALVYELRSLGIDRVVVADGGSTDRTVAEVRMAGALVTTVIERTPISTCLMSAWRVALASSVDGVVQMDAGWSHQPKDTVRLAAALSDFDMVIGSRFHGGPYTYYDGPLSRRLRSRAMSIAANAITRAHFTDWTSGMRAFRAPLLTQLLNFEYVSTMHTWQIEVLAEARRLHATIGEVPIYYRSGRSSASRAIVDIPGCLWRLLVT